MQVAQKLQKKLLRRLHINARKQSQNLFWRLIRMKKYIEILCGI